MWSVFQKRIVDRNGNANIYPQLTALAIAGRLDRAMRDLTKRGWTIVSPRWPKGFAFEIADHVLIRRWARRHAFSMLVRLDHGAEVDEEYEEVIALQTETIPLYRLIMWRSTAWVFVQPVIGRMRRYLSVTAALESLLPKPQLA